MPLTKLNSASVIDRLPVGSVLQTLSTTKTDTFISSSTSYTDVTGLSLAITPSSTSSKILVICHLGTVSNNNHYSGFRFVRGSTSIGIGTSGGTYNDSFSFYNLNFFIAEIGSNSLLFHT